MELTQFMNVISQLVLKACHVINSVYQSSSLGIQMKSHRNPVTEADIKVQSMIVRYLTHLWPSIQIVGEENIPFEEGNEVSIGDQIENYTELLREYFESTQLNLEDFCVWIDPLDGTLSFTEGRLEDVTVMVGVSYKQKARIGIIGIPYERASSHTTCVFNPRVMMSDSKNQSVIQINRDFSLIKSILCGKPHPNKLVVSQNLSYQQTEILKNITNETVKTYAMGNKFIRVIKEKAAGLVYMGSFASLWDTCAGQALIKSLGGLVTNLLGNDIIYDNNRSNYLLGNGIVCAFQKQMIQNINSNMAILAETS